MSQPDTLTVLNQAFVRIYRSFGQYLREACIEFDVGEETVRELLQREANDAERLGTAIGARQGSVYTGTYPIEFGDLHFLNSSCILTDWLGHQRQLVEDLHSERSTMGEVDDPTVALLDEIIANERDALAKIEALQQPAKQPTASPE